MPMSNDQRMTWRKAALTVYALNINTTSENISGNKNTLLECLELLVAVDTLCLWQSRVNANTWEVAVSEESIELCRAADRLDEDDNLQDGIISKRLRDGKMTETYLIELKRVEQVVELSVLGSFSELDVVLLKTVQGQLGLVINVDLEGLFEHTMI